MLSLLDTPTSLCPLEIPNNFPAILLTPAPASLMIAPVNPATTGMKGFTILKPLYATISFGSSAITLAIISACSSKNPANA